MFDYYPFSRSLTGPDLGTRIWILGELVLRITERDKTNDVFNAIKRQYSSVVAWQWMLHFFVRVTLIKLRMHQLTHGNDADDDVDCVRVLYNAGAVGPSGFKVRYLKVFESCWLCACVVQCRCRLLRRASRCAIWRCLSPSWTTVTMMWSSGLGTLARVVYMKHAARHVPCTCLSSCLSVHPFVCLSVVIKTTQRGHCH